MTDLNHASKVPGLAVVIGAGGGIGAALTEQLRRSGDFSEVIGLGRGSLPAIDYGSEPSLKAAAQFVAERCASTGQALQMLVVASGFLHGEAGQPERSFAHFDAAYLKQVFAINTLGPALVMKHFFPLLPKQGRCVAGFLSARVGSITDNALGGWFGYRASKAALNQLVKTASIELTRRNRQSICVALHPGTVDTALSEPFAKAGLNVRPPAEAATDLLRVMAELTPIDTGALIDFRGQKIGY